jgi:predicted phage terminase large subunit-like protein
LLDVFRQKLEFPALRRMILELAELHHAHIVLIEDKASGTSLIQDLRAASFSKVQAAPALDGNKVMRLRLQTAKIEGGFVRFPKKAPWLDEYLRELTSFPNSKYDDQVDSTVFALAWVSANPEPHIVTYYRFRAEGWTDADIAVGRHRGAERDIPVMRDPAVENEETNRLNDIYNRVVNRVVEKKTLCDWCGEPLTGIRFTDGEYICHQCCYPMLRAGSIVSSAPETTTPCAWCAEPVGDKRDMHGQDVYHPNCYREMVSATRRRADRGGVSY